MIWHRPVWKFINKELLKISHILIHWCYFYRAIALEKNRYRCHHSEESTMRFFMVENHPHASYCCFYMSRHSLFFNIFMQVILIELSISSNFLEAFSMWIKFLMFLNVRNFAWIFQGISISVHHDYCNNFNQYVRFSLIYIKFLGNVLLISSVQSENKIM